MKKLFTVIRQGNFDEVKRLIEKKPELVNCVSGELPKKDRGQSPLQVALKTGRYEIAWYLLEHGADVNHMEADDAGPDLHLPVLCDAVNSALISLCYGNFSGSEAAYALVEELVKRGADVNRQGSNGEDAMAWAIRRAELLLENPRLYPTAQDAARSMLTRILDMLIAHGADVQGWMQRACYCGLPEGPTNKESYLDDFVPDSQGAADRHPAQRAFMQAYFRSRKLLG